MEPNGDKRRGFAVGAPARRSRDGNGKIAVRGGEAMAAKRTTAQGGFAQRNAAPDFARQTQKAGPMTGQPGFAAGEMRPNGSKGRGGNGSRVWEKRKAPAFAGVICIRSIPSYLVFVLFFLSHHSISIALYIKHLYNDQLEMYYKNKNDHT